MRRITVRLADYVEEEKRRDRRAGHIVAALAIVAGLVIAISATNMATSLHVAGTASERKVLRLRNDGGSPLTIAKVTTDCATLAPNESCGVVVVFAPPNTDTQSGGPSVQTDTGSTTMPPADLGATDFGSAPLGTVVARSIRFTNKGSTPIVMAKSSVDAPF